MRRRQVERRPQVALAQPERLLEVEFLGPLSGPLNYDQKQLRLVTRPHVNGNQPAAEAELSVREGDWLMLSASTPSGQGLFRWWRIIDTDSEAMPLYNQNNGAPDPSR